MSDDIVENIINGNEEAFRRFYKIYSSIVYNTALSYLQNQEDAEEVTQDVFVTVFRKMHSYRKESKLSTWIYRITVNSSLNYIKKKKRIERLKLNAPNNQQIDFVHPGVIIENRENAALIFALIDRLPESQKTAFILGFIEELPRKEVADIMGISLKAVESLLQRAKRNLRETLGDFFPNRRNS